MGVFRATTGLAGTLGNHLAYGGKMKGLGSAQILGAFSCLWAYSVSCWPWLVAGFLCRS